VAAGRMADGCEEQRGRNPSRRERAEGSEALPREKARRTGTDNVHRLETRERGQTKARTAFVSLLLLHPSPFPA
jgi:hypothetical protein